MTNKQVNNPPAIQSDEIDLLELWNKLWSQKWLIVFITFSFIILSTLYAFLSTPSYKSGAYFLPPSPEGVQEMNVLNLMMDKKFISEEEVFQSFLDELASRGAQRAIFDKYQLADLYDEGINGKTGLEYQAALNTAFQKFTKYIQIKYPGKKDKTDAVSVFLTLEKEPDEVATILNDLVTNSQEKAVKQYYEKIVAEVQQRKSHLKDKITSLRVIEKDRRFDRIVRLEEAAKIARSLDISEPSAMGPRIEVEDVVSQGLPLYYLGYRLLEAELSILRQRENDDPFIVKLRGLQQSIAELEALKLRVDKFSVMTLDQEAIPASKPAKPKKLLIIAVGAVFGLFLGVMVALIRSAIRKV